MTKKFSDLVAAMPPEAQKEIQIGTDRELAKLCPITQTADEDTLESHPWIFPVAYQKRITQ